MGITDTLYGRLVSPVMERTPTRITHFVGEGVMRRLPWGAVARFNGLDDDKLQIHLCGITLPGPIGAAAGMDKHCHYLDNLLNVGFGFATGGTITPEPLAGNPRPHVARRPREHAVINSLGFPNDGADRTLPRFHTKPANRHRRFASISADDEDGFVQLYQRVQGVAPLVEINISSPNRRSLANFHKPKVAASLIKALVKHRRSPLLVKLPRLVDDDGEHSSPDLLALAEAVLGEGPDGLIVANSLPVEEPSLATGHGGLTGAPLLPSTLMLVRTLREVAGDDLPLVASGGITTAQDVQDAINAGAAAVQLYTAMVYRGPWWAARMNHDLRRLRGLD